MADHGEYTRAIFSEKIKMNSSAISTVPVDTKEAERPQYASGLYLYRPVRSAYL
jgi:hypothetical protein